MMYRKICPLLDILQITYILLTVCIGCMLLSDHTCDLCNCSYLFLIYHFIIIILFFSVHILSTSKACCIFQMAPAWVASPLAAFVSSLRLPQTPSSERRGNIIPSPILNKCQEWSKCKCFKCKFWMFDKRAYRSDIKSWQNIPKSASWEWSWGQNWGTGNGHLYTSAVLWCNG